MKKFAIATPTYNEKDNIKKLIPEIYKACSKIDDASFSVLVIDDDSPDKTADAADVLAKKYDSPNFKINVLRRKSKDGIGRAYVSGFNVLLKQGFDYIIQIDADLSHNPKYLKEFVRMANEGYDFVSASRYVKGGGTPGWGIHRIILSRGGNLYARLFLGSKITDYTGGYNMYSSSLLRNIDTVTLSSGGYGFLIELKYRALQKSTKAGQFPFVFQDRIHGQSKIPKSTLFKNFILVPKIRLSKKSNS